MDTIPSKRFQNVEVSAIVAVYVCVKGRDNDISQNKEGLLFPL